MNMPLSTLIAGLLLAGASQAFAASSVDLTVTGLITPSSCTPTLSNGGALDYGKISAKDLNVDRETPLEKKTLQLIVTCDAATLIALEGNDNRSGSSYMGYLAYGLGLINGTEKLGGMHMRLDNATADSVPGKTIVSEDGGNTWSPDPYFLLNWLMSVADASGVAPAPVQVLTADLTVEPRIAPTNQLTLTNEAAIDGSVTLTVVYL